MAHTSLLLILVSVAPEPKLEWFRDDDLIEEGEKFHVTRESLGTCHLDIRPIDINDQVGFASNNNQFHISRTKSAFKCIVQAFSLV